MNRITTYLADRLLNHIFIDQQFRSPPRVYMGLYSKDPGKDGLPKEIDDGGYRRKEIQFLSASNGRAKNSIPLSFTGNSNWGTITHFAIFDDETAGNVLFTGEMTEGFTPSDNETFRFNAGDVIISASKNPPPNNVLWIDANDGTTMWADSGGTDPIKTNFDQINRMDNKAAGVPDLDTGSAPFHTGRLDLTNFNALATEYSNSSTSWTLVAKVDLDTNPSPSVILSSESGALNFALDADGNGVGWYDGAWDGAGTPQTGVQYLAWKLNPTNPEIFRGLKNLGTGSYAGVAFGDTLAMGWGHNSSDSMDGYIEELFLFDRPLDEEEIYNTMEKIASNGTDYTGSVTWSWSARRAMANVGTVSTIRDDSALRNNLSGSMSLDKNRVAIHSGTMDSRTTLDLTSGFTAVCVVEITNATQNTGFLQQSTNFSSPDAAELDLAFDANGRLTATTNRGGTSSQITSFKTFPSSQKVLITIDVQSDSEAKILLGGKKMEYISTDSTFLPDNVATLRVGTGYGANTFDGYIHHIAIDPTARSFSDRVELERRMMKDWGMDIPAYHSIMQRMKDGTGGDGDGVIIGDHDQGFSSITVTDYYTDVISPLGNIVSHWSLDTLEPVTLTATEYIDTDAFGSHTLRVDLLASELTDGDTFGSHTISELPLSYYRDFWVPVVGTSNTVAHYEMDESSGVLVDSGPNGYDSDTPSGIFYGDDDPDTKAPDQGTSIRFNGSANDSVTFGPKSRFNYIQNGWVFTISFWLWMYREPDNSFVILGTQTGGLGIRLLFFNNGNGFVDMDDGTSSAVINFDFDPYYAINTGKIAHVVITSDGSTATMYVNAEEVNSTDITSLSATASDSENVLTLESDSNGENFNVDALSFADISISAEDVDRLYSDRISLLENATVWFKFEEATVSSGSTCTNDALGATFDGEYTNGFTAQQSPPDINSMSNVVDYSIESAIASGGPAVRFDKSDADLHAEDHTILMYFKCGFDESTSSIRHTVWGNNSGGHEQKHDFFFKTDDANAPVFFRVSNGTSFEKVEVNDNQFYDGDWHAVCAHIVWGDKARLWIDGTLDPAYELDLTSVPAGSGTGTDRFQFFAGQGDFVGNGACAAIWLGSDDTLSDFDRAMLTSNPDPTPVLLRDYKFASIWLKLDEADATTDPQDSSVNNRHGAWTSSTSNLEFQQSLPASFSNTGIEPIRTITDYYLGIPSSAGGEGFNMELDSVSWITNNDWQLVTYLRLPSGASTNQLNIFSQSEDGGGFILSMYDNRAGTKELRFRINDGTNYTVEDATDILSDNDWHRVAYQMDWTNNEMKMWVDGTQVGSTVDITGHSFGNLTAPRLKFGERGDTAVTHGEFDFIAVALFVGSDMVPESKLTEL